MPAPFSGGCRCGAIRYTVSTDPLMAAHCHCRDCQYSTGGANATVVLVPAPAVSIEKGAPRGFTVDAESGGKVTREFCADCGSPIFSKLESNNAVLVIKAGSLDDPSWITPAMHFWTSSAQPWGLHDDGLPRVEKNPG